MSPPATLRSTCVRKTGSLLTRGMYDECPENPFSRMPISIVDDLLSCVWLAISPFSRACIAHSRLLLTSGRLERVVLPPGGSEADYVTLLRLLSRGCQNLRTLTVPEVISIRRPVEAERALQELLRNSAKLEHLHSYVYFEPDDLGNCLNLKSLRLHLEKEASELFSRRATRDLLKRQRSVEMFALCWRPRDARVGERLHLARAILDNCPRLICLGFLDSSAALEELHARDLKTRGAPRRFQLRRCYWKVKETSGPDYCDRIRVAASSCPLVETLVIEVHDAACLKHLEALRNLNSLTIDFQLCENDYEREFYSMLKEMGAQLRHLTLYVGFKEGSSVGAVQSPVTVEEGVQHCLPNLERLRVHGCRRKCLFFLLSNCPRLKMLSLHCCVDLGDGALRAILQKNSFSGLEVALIDGCSASESGWRGFLQSAPKLSSCCLGSYLLDSDEARRCVRDLNPSAVCHSSDDFYEVEKRHFSADVDSSCWV